MKLRIARKIIELSTGDDGNPTNRYTENQLQRAVNRYRRCRTSKETDKFFDDIFAYQKKREEYYRTFCAMLDAGITFRG